MCVLKKSTVYGCVFASHMCVALGDCCTVLLHMLSLTESDGYVDQAVALYVQTVDICLCLCWQRVRCKCAGGSFMIYQPTPSHPM